MNLILTRLLCCALVLTACASPPPSGKHSSSPELSQWVDTELLPYVAKHLGQHPKFKHQPVLVVSIQGDDIQPEIDNLTRYIRNQIMETLLDTPGANLLWHPTIRPWQHHRYLADLSCGEFNQARYYIGVDIHNSPLDSTVEVSVRALDVHEKKWVSGFHQSWRGQLTPVQQEALSQRYKDEYLRGLRPLPFTADQPDLLASYLAHNLNCLLRHSQTSEEILIYAGPPQNSDLPYFRTALELVDNYLGRSHNVQVVTDPQQATFILESQVHYLHHGLYQVWVTLHNTQDRRYLPGTKTKAYVRLSEPSPPQRQTPALSRRLISPPQPPPLISPPQPPPHPRLFSAERGLTPPSQYVRSQNSGSLIKWIRLRSTPDWRECVTQSRWFGERWVRVLGDVFNSTPCLLVEVAVNHSAHLLLVGQNSQGKLNWMLPASCKTVHAAGVYLKSGEIHRSPLPIEKIQFLELDKMTGQSRIYAIAVAEEASAENRWTQGRPKAGKKLLYGSSSYVSLVANRLGLCKNQWLSRTSPSSWLGQLDALTAESGQRVQWKGIKLWHTPHNRLQKGLLQSGP